jgi:hypothetical protein
MKRLLFLCCLLSVLAAGCNMANDNPIDTKKMEDIRAKQSQEMGNFNPNKAGGAAPGQTAPPAGK